MPPLAPASRQAETSARAKHVLLSRALECDLAQGRYRVGDTLPSEPELTRHFGVSRHTVRAALRTLQARGLIASRQGVGSVVQATTVPRRYTQGYASVEDLLQYVASTRVVQVERVELTADAALADWLGCRAGERWWKLTRLRFQTGADRPCTLAHVYLPHVFGPLLDELDHSDRPIFRAVEERTGEPIAEIRQEIAATRPNAREAALLQAPRSQATLAIVRRYLGAHGRVLEVTRTLHHDFTYTMNMRLAHAASAPA